MANVRRKSIPDHPGYYADRQGRIWRKFSGRWRIINPVTHHDGYQYTSVGGQTRKLTQRLVCAAFKGECIEELPICVRRAKRQQPRRLRSQRYLKWGLYSDIQKKSGWHHLTCKQQLRIIKLHNNGATQISLAKKFLVTQPAISYLVNGRTRLREAEEK